MADNFEKLSPEQLKKLAGVISGAKDLTAQQAEIIEKVLAGEEVIGKVRIAYLQEYVDTYSKHLDAVARKQSQLDDAFLILDSKIADSRAESYKASEENAEYEIANLEEISKAKKQKLDQETYDKLNSEEDFTKHKKQLAQELEDYLKDLHLNEEERKNNLDKLSSDYDNRGIKREADRLKFRQSLAEKEKNVISSIYELQNLKALEAADKEDMRMSVRLNKLQEVTNAEINAQKLFNDFDAEIDYAMNSQTLGIGDNGQEISEAGALAAQMSAAKDLDRFMRKQDNARIEYIRKQEEAAKRKNGGILSKEESTRIQKLAAEKFKLDEKNLVALAAKQQLLDSARAASKERDELRSLTDQALHGKTTSERYEAFKKLTTDDAGERDTKKAMTAALLAVSDLAKQLEGTIDEIASHKGLVDTRLQGSSNKQRMGSYWDQIIRDITSVSAVNPYFKQKDFAANVEKLVDSGIAFDLEQRAFLMTISEKVAKTFDVADSTLLRLIRIQQQDSTAGRLGMESALNAFLNEMYETSEYLTQVADGVRNSLEEMESLMEGAEAAEVEYQVQKWLGSLYSVGMSQSAVNSISTALGQIAAGQIEGLTSGGAGNLLIMAANDAGLSIADILTEGLDSTDTNKLLEASVKYLAELAESSKENNVVQQQLADVFGVKASDLRAATNLVIPGSTDIIAGNSLTYGNMMGRLYEMAGNMHQRTSLAEMMANLWDNVNYSVAGSMANNPISYFIYKSASLLDSAAGGIDLPFVNAMGWGVDLNTTVSDLMRVAAVGTGILGSIGALTSGLSNSFSGRQMLDKLGIKSENGLAVTPRGGGNIAGSVGGGSSSLSESGYAGNASGSDVKESTLQEAEDSKKQQMIEAKEEAEANQVDVLNETVIKIYELLDDVANGGGSFKVKVEGYGLTKAGGGGASLGGLSAAANADSGSGGGYSLTSTGSGAFSDGSMNSAGMGGSVNIGGWTTG